ncbi:Mannose-6-phosphate isomerase, cupin superfamily [Parafrankia irregularis]|uniref:Mannose-6-phosphate isomerase, cupin superfamily n=1 Tax=Parafrankia irregularis TaxID=795642 RepID=A0A0S4QG93_9ACTN|nr:MULTISPECIES: cupin domain-containing protein [Parafrankia]MBE3199708.1 cupin domain-containing protein [Parafrankia sp. CH37]CUU53622.1 Mannose-6-phosphate isomerase, cupin superfamily [Parafrankia irregularis]
MDLIPVDLLTAVLRLRPGGTVTAEPRRMDADDEGWTVAVTHAETDQDVHGDHWEVHPGSDEAVCVLSGRARIVLRPEETDGAQTVVALAAGTGLVVPRGRWHRFELDAPSDLMSIALRSGSRLEQRA